MPKPPPPPPTNELLQAILEELQQMSIVSQMTLTELEELNLFLQSLVHVDVNMECRECTIGKTGKLIRLDLIIGGVP